MASQLTVTKSKTGPGVTIAATVITGLKTFNLDMDRKVLSTTSTSPNGPAAQEFDINATTTLTCTITAGANCTLVINEP